MIVERRDRRVHLHAPVIGELLGDLAVDVAVGPNDEIELVDLGAWPIGPRVCRTPVFWKSADRSQGQRAAQRFEEVATPQSTRSDQPSNHAASPLARCVQRTRSYDTTEESMEDR